MAPLLGASLADTLSGSGRRLSNLFGRNPREKFRRTAAVAIVGLTAVSSCATWKATGRAPPRMQVRKRCLHPMAVDAIAGALGEIVQVAALYPLDTIKVRCQARGLRMAVVLHELRGVACRRTAFVSLYAGMGATAAASAVIGSCYLVTFYAAKRLAAGGVAQLATRCTSREASREITLEGRGGSDFAAAVAAGEGGQWVMAAGSGVRQGPASVALAFASITDSALVLQRTHHAQQGKHGRGQRRYQPRVASPERTPLDRSWRGSETPDAVSSTSRDALIGVGSASGFRIGAGTSVSFRSSSLVALPARHGLGSSFFDAHDRAAIEERCSNGEGAAASAVMDNPWTDTAAALFASVSTSVLEGPVEVFRHRLQAGTNHGAMLTNMAAALSGGGIRSVYHGYLPFMLKGIPYDVAELLTYSQLSAARARGQSRAAAAADSEAAAARRWNLPDTAADLLMGGAAGAAAVLASMPADCIKTLLELDPSPEPAGLVAGALRFLSTGRAMVAKAGPSALFVGMAPRLAEKVPSTMFYWLTVEGCRRALEPFTIQEDKATPAEAP